MLSMLGRSILAVIALVSPCALAQDLPRPAEALVIGPTGPSGRIVIAPDAVGRELVAGSWAMPTAGDAVELPAGAGGSGGEEKKWRSVEIADGLIRAPELRGGYAAVSVPSEADRVLMLDARGHGMVFINGEPRVGDPYGLGYVTIPVRLRAGENTLLFKGGRGDIRFAFREPRGAVEILADHTLPDLVEGGSGARLAGVLIANCTDEWARGLTISAGFSSVDRPIVSPVPAIPPLGVCKVAVEFPTAAAAEPMLHIEVVRGGEVIAGSEHALAVRKGTEVRKVTFRSAIDGSVQYYALRPSTKPDANQSLILSLHGASVEATSQANAYTPKDWAAVVAPTNRRPYGFDWEDWGRLDALEVLAHATEALKPDPRRIYLTGHSMGGHGAWQLGAHFAHRFPVVAPSAGWISFWSYTGAGENKGDSPVADALRRAASPSDTLALKENYANTSLYIIHGEKDDNVPAEQSRTMKRELLKFHDDFIYHEQPGAGHWWGNECVDWPPLWEFARARPGMVTQNVHRVRFSTAAPSVSSRAFWAEIVQQVAPFRTSSVDLVLDRELRILKGTTANVRTLALDLAHIEGDVTATIDGAEIVVPRSPGTPVLIRRDGGAWSILPKLDPGEKSPARGGAFKDAFRNNVLLVVGTAGSPEENAQLLAKARYDSETFWYRGNATLPIVLDSEFDPASEPDRNIVLYGNAGTNRAWGHLLAECPLHIAPGLLCLGEAEMAAPGLAVLMIRPRPGSDTASVGVIAGTDPEGFRLAGRVPYFVSGVAVPDYLIVAPDAMESGVEGIVGAGFFDNQWRLPPGASLVP